MAHRIPATVITGFLGAGKTSLIRHIIENSGGRRLAFLINEFGDLGVDRELLLGCGIEGCDEGDVVELANGCICCTVADDFVPAIETLLARDVLPDHILIETSGLALPKPLVKAFNWPEIKANVTVDGVIAVIDADAVNEGRFAHDLVAVENQRRSDPMLDHDSPLEEVYEDQLTCADMVILNKADLLDEAALNRVSSGVSDHTRHGVSVVTAAHAQVAPEILLGIGAEAEADLNSRPSHHDSVDGEHDHDDFDSFTLELGPIDDAGFLQAQLAEIVRTHEILRIKGFIDRPGRDRREVIQGVGPRIERYFDRDWRPGEERRTRIVFIAETGFDSASITAAIVGQLDEPSQVTAARA
jgi:cobalamin biosynthesis protein CobW